MVVEGAEKRGSGPSPLEKTQVKGGRWACHLCPGDCQESRLQPEERAPPAEPGGELKKHFSGSGHWLLASWAPLPASFLLPWGCRFSAPCVVRCFAWQEGSLRLNAPCAVGLSAAGLADVFWVIFWTPCPLIIFFSIVVFCQTASLGNLVLLTHSRILNNSESYCK